MTRSFNPRVVRALAKRDVRLYFNNPAGYVFVTLFIFLSAVAAFWQRRFFLNNLANLEQLNDYFAYLLLFFIPTVTMGTWADERRQGTDELLLTLPASDLDIVLAKFGAALSIYTVSLGFSLTHVLVLKWLGSPDPGLMAANYLGYWLAGASLLAVGMLGSLLTSNLTVAFILGVALCSVPIVIGTVAKLFTRSAMTPLNSWGLNSQLSDFFGGVVSLSGVFYFVSLASFFLYLNVLLVGRRRWVPHSSGIPLVARVIVQIIAVFVSLVAISVMISRVSIRLDATAEGLHSLSQETRQLLKSLSAEHPVVIQAFVSPDVPELYVQTRANLVNVLREIESRADTKVQVLISETVPYSPAARIARERFGIGPVSVADVDNAGTARDGIYLAVALTSGAEEQIIPFIDRGLSPEYELMSAIRVVTETTRKRVGIVETDAKLLGGVDSDSGQPRRPWAVVRELSKQYDVFRISPSEPITQKVDALLIVQPSTLLQQEMDFVEQAIARGVPALILVDPVPSIDMRLSPSATMAVRADPFAVKAPILRKNFGDIQKMMSALGVTWAPTRIVWDKYNPHPDMAELPPEVVFIGRGSGSREPFNIRAPATADLQEVLVLYGGTLNASNSAAFRFTPLLRTGPLSGTVGYFQLVQPSPNGAVLNRGLLHDPEVERQEYVVAARVDSQPDKGRVNAIVIADLDFITDQVFEIRSQGVANAAFDNVTFFLNCLDDLTENRLFIDLRKRRVRHRTLERVEQQTRVFTEKQTQREKQAEHDAQQALDAAQQRQKIRIDEIRDRADLDEQARQLMMRNVDALEKRRFEVVSANIQSAEQAEIQSIREEMESQVQGIQNTIRTTAVILPPLPVFALGMAVMMQRRKRVKKSAAAVNRLRKSK